MNKYFRIHYNEKHGPKTTAVARGAKGIDAFCNLGHPPEGYRYVTAEEISEADYLAEKHR